MSADGRVIVGSSSPNANNSARKAFRWTAESGMVALGVLLGAKYAVSEAYAVSDDGAVIVGYGYSSDGGKMAIRWTMESVMVPLGRLPGDADSFANALSADGLVIVGTSRFYSEDSHAFIWDAAQGMRNLQEVLTNDCALDLSGWTLTSASDISADGRVIVGSGTNPQGNTEAFRAVIPEPSSLTLLATLAAAALLRRACRRRKGC